MSVFERYVSEVIEDECEEDTEERLSSSNGQFTALQILQPFPWSSVRLESTCRTLHGKIVYRRLGVLTLEHPDPEDAACPELLKMLSKSEKSIRNRSDPRSKPRWKSIRQCQHVLEELIADAWPMQTVVIV